MLMDSTHEKDQTDKQRLYHRKRRDKELSGLLMKAWSRSEHSRACFAHCQEFISCSSVCVPGPLAFT